MGERENDMKREGSWERGRAIESKRIGEREPLLADNILIKQDKT